MVSLDLMQTLGIATFVLFCAVSRGALALDRSPAPIRLGNLPPPTPARLRDLASPDCVVVAKHVGIDYMQALNRAIAKDPAGLATLFRFTDTSGYDGAAGEGHLEILVLLLERWAIDRSLMPYAPRSHPFAKLSLMTSTS